MEIFFHCFGGKLARSPWVSLSFYNEARPIDFLRRSIRVFEYALRMASGWKTDKILVSHLERHVRENLRRCEILDFVKRDFPSYPWSLPILARRLSYFKISYKDASVDVEIVKNIVKNELCGPGKLLGHRVMTQKLRTVHGIKVPRHLVRNILFDFNPDGLQGRSLQNKQRTTKEPFTLRGSLCVLSVGGHDKLRGYQNWMLPLRLYGFIDTFSKRYYH